MNTVTGTKAGLAASLALGLTAVGAVRSGSWSWGPAQAATDMKLLRVER